MKKQTSKIKVLGKINLPQPPKGYHLKGGEAFPTIQALVDHVVSIGCDPYNKVYKDGVPIGERVQDFLQF